MKAVFIGCILIVLHTGRANAGGGTNSCAEKNKEHYHLPGAIADRAEQEYDIKYVKFDLHFTDTSIYIAGNVTTRAQVIATSLKNYVFELDESIVIDSVKINDRICKVHTKGSVRKVHLPRPIEQNALFSAQVFYHGSPSSTNTGFFTGLTHAITATGVNMVYTISDPYAAKDWWPCKQSLTDKIDSADIWITVPEGLKAGSNGLLQSVTAPMHGCVQYRWKTRYPIDYYLLSVAVAPYADYTYYVHFTGSTDSMQIKNYFYDSVAFMQRYKANFDSVGMMVDYFSTLYGRYPFYKEKYGHCFTTLGGGMEHQTMTTIGVTETPLIAHELGHQWFGDNVTYATWGDVWLSEGFATYTEQLYIAHFWGEEAALKYRTMQYNRVMAYPDGSVYVRDTLDVNSLFGQRLVYDKGAAVVHMLRYLAPQDSLFFKVLSTYQRQYASGTASTTNLKKVAEQVYNKRLDTFFNQWIYGEGYPTYTAKWKQEDGKIYVQITQTTSVPASVPLFAMPLTLKLVSPVGDTVVKIYNNRATQLYVLPCAKEVTGIIIDPDKWILGKVASVINAPGLQDTNKQ